VVGELAEVSDVTPIGQDVAAMMTLTELTLTVTPRCLDAG